MRALRVDKLTYAAPRSDGGLLSERARDRRDTALAALSATKEAITRRARAFVRRARSISAPELKPQMRFLCQCVSPQSTLIDGASVVGGGSAPETQLPTILIGVASDAGAPTRSKRGCVPTTRQSSFA